MTICEDNICTGCAACREVCPKGCISFEADGLGALYPQIDVSKCTECGLCHNICPNNRPPIYHHPKRAFAAWSNDAETRRTSASGGVATEMYRLFLSEGGRCVGVRYDIEKGAIYQFVENEQDIRLVRNSKYTYSYTNGIYREVKNALKAGVEVLFIGLPCQVSGLQNFLKRDYDNLYTVDIICHGVAPTEYIQQHVKRVESTKSSKTTEVIFRDPTKGTHRFFLSLYDKSKCFYSKNMEAADLYQIGYHKALIYRENCYRCAHARAERVGDLTIGDFSGLGRDASCSYNGIGVSCVLANTEKGLKLVKRLSQRISLFERPLSEALNYEGQLRQPSAKHPQREQFEASYKATANFEESAKRALKQDVRRFKMAKLSPMPYFRACVRALTTPQIRAKIKKMIKFEGNV